MKYTEIINSNPYVLVEFYASWCPHCQKMMPIVAEIKKLLADTLKVEQFDIDEYPDLASEAGAESIPTFILYHNGEERWRHSGEMPAETLLSEIQKHA
ncbi:MAG: thioredoxin family protein [Muribaculaceae bacterium]|nr:thioredoxin family protein [Muribaculaceae bacterium]